jgi:hypothetical protein
MGSFRRWIACLAVALVGASGLAAAVYGTIRESFAGPGRPIARPRSADPLRLLPVAERGADPGEPSHVEFSPSPGPPPGPSLAPPSPPETVPEIAMDPAPAVGTPDLDCTPVAADGYRRGRRTPITLFTIDGAPLERATANAYWAMREAAAAEGHELTIFSAYRTQDEQQHFYDCYRSCACNNCSPAAKPGYSNHQMGRAVDIAMWPGVQPWLDANARRFGFVATVAGEPWHWELRRGAKPPKRPACPAD